MKTKLVNENYTQNYITNLLSARGIKDIDRFCNPTSDDLQSYKDLENIDKGVQLIKDLRPEHNRIGLVTDCDVDK